MREKTKRVKGLIQRLYITWDAFMANDLFTYASAGAYSFLISALPVILIVLVILIRILGTTPEVIEDFLGDNPLFTQSLNFNSFLESVKSIKSVGIFEVVIGFSVFSMARRFFTSIQQGIRIIYRKRGKSAAIKENLVVIAGEVILIFLVVILSIFLMAGNSFFRSDESHSLFSPAVFHLLRILFAVAPLGILVAFLFLVYYYSPKTKPRPIQCFLSAAACSVSFGIIHIIFSSFVNMSRYNLVYGILSNVIVVLLEVYIFFFLFLFFAQFLYVIQYFESFLLTRIYLLPRYEDPDPMKQLERMLFIEPTLFFADYAVIMKEGETVFRLGDDSTELYYIWQGAVRLYLPNQVMDIGAGRVFGEFSGIIGASRTATAVALSDLFMLKIPTEIFQETIEIDGAMSHRTLLMIADYVRKKNVAPLSTEV